MAYCPECQTNSQIVSSLDTLEYRCSNCFSVLDFPQATTLEVFQNLEKEVFDKVQRNFFNTYGKPSSEQNKFERRSFFSYLRGEGFTGRFFVIVFLAIGMIGGGLTIPLVSQLQNEVFSGHESSVNLILVLIKVGLILSGILICVGYYQTYNRVKERYDQNQEKFEWHSKLVYSHEAYKHLKKIPYLFKDIIATDKSRKLHQQTKHNYEVLRLTGILDVGTVLALLIISNNLLGDPVAMILAGIAFISISISIVCLISNLFDSDHINDSLDTEPMCEKSTSIGILSLILSIVVLYHRQLGRIIASFF